MNLYQLVYKCYAVSELTPEEFADILVEARVNNVKMDVTGCLLFKDGVFLQVLEGDKQNLLKLYKKIQFDQRHTQVDKLYFESANERTFKKWSMKMINLSFEGNNAFQELYHVFVAAKNNEIVDGVPASKRLLDYFKQSH